MAVEHPLTLATALWLTRHVAVICSTIGFVGGAATVYVLNYLLVSTCR